MDDVTDVNFHLFSRHLDFFDMVRGEDERELARRYDEVTRLQSLSLWLRSKI